MNSLSFERKLVASEMAAAAFDLARSKRPLDRLIGLKILGRLADTDQPHTFQGLMDQWDYRSMTILDDARKSPCEPVKRQAESLESSLVDAMARYETWHASQLSPRPKANMCSHNDSLS